VRIFAFHPGLSMNDSPHLHLTSPFKGGIKTAMGKSVVPGCTYESLGDTPELLGGFVPWLVTKGKKVDFLRGRYLSANWASISFNGFLLAS